MARMGKMVELGMLFPQTTWPDMVTALRCISSILAAVISNPQASVDWQVVHSSSLSFFMNLQLRCIEVDCRSFLIVRVVGHILLNENLHYKATTLKISLDNETTLRKTDS